MKKIKLEDLQNIRGGMKCIYHYMAILPAAMFGIWGTIKNLGGVVECWNNNHVE